MVHREDSIAEEDGEEGLAVEEGQGVDEGVDGGLVEERDPMEGKTLVQEEGLGDREDLEEGEVVEGSPSSEHCNGVAALLALVSHEGHVIFTRTFSLCNRMSVAERKRVY